MTSQKNFLAIELLYRILRRSVLAFSFIIPVVITCSCDDTSSYDMADDDPGMAYITFSPQIMHVTDAARAPFALLTDSFPPNNTYKLGFWISKTGDTTYSAYTKGMANMEADYLPGKVINGIRDDVWSFNYADDTHRRLGIKIDESVDIYSYFPYSKGADNLKAVSFRSGCDDLLYADPVKGVFSNVAGEKSINLHYRHALTCIQIKLTCEHSARISFDKILIEDIKADTDDWILYAGGTLDVTTGIVTPTGLTDKVELDSIGITIDTEKVIPPLYIMLPAISNYSDKRFNIHFFFDGKKTPVPLPLSNQMTVSGETKEVTSFEKGKMYIYEVTLDNQLRFSTVKVSQADKWKAKEIIKEIEL